MLMNIIAFLVGLLGAAALTYGALLWSAPLGWAVAGLLALSWSAWLSRAIASHQYNKQRGGD
ncbi:hypothetical protein ACL00X_06980 [Aeromonas diversa]|uniref:hypothetical protein n=1 Tax=Aeromonas diversa TaxID=502790 RepID=UPI0039A2E1EF